MSKLKAAMAGMDLSKSKDTFFTDATAVEKLEMSAMRIAVLAHQIEKIDGGNPAISFIRETQISSHYVAVLIALGLYKPAAASIRSIFETFQYYTYFRTHPSELTSISRSSGYYIDKRDVLLFHKEHTEKFVAKQQSLGLVSRLDNWYTAVSAIIHGQLPGVWIHHTSVADIGHSKEVSESAIQMYQDGVDIVVRLFLCTFASEIWVGVSSTARKTLLQGITKPQREILELDGA